MSSSKLLRTVIGRTIKRIERPSVRRSLFGSPDPKSVQKALMAQSDAIDAEIKREWNFDFIAEQPLPGAWIWKSVDHDSSKSTPHTPQKSHPKSPQKATPMKRKLDVLRDSNGVKSPIKRRHLAVQDKENPNACKTLFCDVTNSNQCKPTSMAINVTSVSCQTVNCNLATAGIETLFAATKGISLKPVKVIQPRRSPRINSSPSMSK